MTSAPLLGAILLLPLLLVATSAQEIDPGTIPDAPPVADGPGWTFSGVSILRTQLATRQGTWQETPRNYARWEVAPTLTWQGVPFTLRTLLTTEQSSVRQRINSVTFELDQSRLQGVLLDRAWEKLSELEELQRVVESAGGIERLRDSLGATAEDKLRELERIAEYRDIARLKERALSEGMEKMVESGLVGSAERIFAGFPSLAIGVTYPSYTALTVDGVPVTGASVEWNPGQFYVAAAAGKTQRAIQIAGVLDSLRYDPTFTRNLYTGRLGFGRRDGGHIILTGAMSRDDEESLPFDSLLQRRVTAQSNYLLGLDIVAPILDDRVTLEGEVVGSMLTGDLQAPPIPQDDLQDLPDAVTSNTEPNVSSHADYAWSLRTLVDIPESATRGSVSVRYTGPGFISLGAPILRTDQIRYDGKLEQRFLRRRLLVTGHLRQEEDNLTGSKGTTTELTQWGIGIGANFSGFPYVRFEYAPYTQRYTYGDAETTIETTTLNGSTGYAYRVSEIDASTSLLLTRQESSSLRGLSDYEATTLTLLQSAAIGEPLFLTAALGWSGLTTQSDSTGDILSLDLGGTWVPNETLSASAGLVFADQGEVGTNVGFSLGGALRLPPYGTFELRGERNVYTNFAIDGIDFQEWVLSAVLTTTW